MTNKFDEELKQNKISHDNPDADAHDEPCDEKCVNDEKRKSKNSDDVKNNSETNEENAENERTEKPASQEKEYDEDLNTKFLRLMADFQNYRKRADKEKSEIYARANEGIMLGLLTVIDNFERAIEHESKDEKYAEGMQLIFKQLMDVLQASGLEEIKALDEDFDPNIHNAVMTCDSDQHESGKVVEVLQKGYLLNGRLLRASMVKVSN
ncbi:MAG: nucleotide exchange factor GrpE [Clostridiales bacterium]|nr:nucleotide exchange factor GrpE [Clostridiales bacterium]MDY6116921.1 nucleotide exchange factor GrpE [Anaerovoracaceae bacterium]